MNYLRYLGFQTRGKNHNNEGAGNSMLSYKGLGWWIEEKNIVFNRNERQQNGPEWLQCVPMLSLRLEHHWIKISFKTKSLRLQIPEVKQNISIGN